MPTDLFRTSIVRCERLRLLPRLRINVSAAARDGVESAVRQAMARADREAYRRHPERPDPFWSDVEAWTEE